MAQTMTSRLRRATLALGLAAAPITVTPAFAEQAVVSTIASEAAALTPGQFVWRPQAQPAGAVEIVVSLPAQMAYVYRGGVLIGATTVSTGREGHETPVGSFEILQKRRDHRSNLYDDAPMPFMQRLTWDGIALHGGAIPGHPASHGCVRLPQSFARSLFGVTQLGASVHITDLDVGAEDALAMVAAPSAVEISAAMD